MSFATYRNRNFVNFLKIIHIKYELILKNTRQSTMNNKLCYIWYARHELILMGASP